MWLFANETPSTVVPRFPHVYAIFDKFSNINNFSLNCTTIKTTFFEEDEEEWWNIHRRKDATTAYHSEPTSLCGIYIPIINVYLLQSTHKKKPSIALCSSAGTLVNVNPRPINCKLMASCLLHFSLFLCVCFSTTHTLASKAGHSLRHHFRHQDEYHESRGNKFARASH